MLLIYDATGPIIYSVVVKDLRSEDEYKEKDKGLKNGPRG